MTISKEKADGGVKTVKTHHNVGIDEVAAVKKKNVTSMGVGAASCGRLKTEKLQTLLG